MLTPSCLQKRAWRGGRPGKGVRVKRVQSVPCSYKTERFSKTAFWYVKYGEVEWDKCFKCNSFLFVRSVMIQNIHTEDSTLLFYFPPPPYVTLIAPVFLPANIICILTHTVCNLLFKTIKLYFLYRLLSCFSVWFKKKMLPKWSLKQFDLIKRN